MEKENKPQVQCLNCQRSDQEVPVVALQFKGQQAWICNQCLPTLIHHAERLADKFAQLED